jgi:hypothetical protein
MIKGMFRATADQQVLAELRTSSQFRFCIDKIRKAQVDAMADLMYATPQDLPAKQGYARALTELVNELTNSGE